MASKMVSIHHLLVVSPGLRWFQFGSVMAFSIEFGLVCWGVGKVQLSHLSVITTFAYVV